MKIIKINFDPNPDQASLKLMLQYKQRMNKSGFFL